MQDSMTEIAHLRMADIASLEELSPVAARPAAKRAMPVYEITRFVQQAGLLFLVSLLAIGSYQLISRYFVQSIEVLGVSMMPTLRDHDHYLLNRLAFREHSPRVKDIVVIVDP